MPGKHLVIRVTPYNKFRLEVVDDETNEVVDSDHFNQLEGLIPAIRVWVSDEVREATGQFDYDKLRGNIDAAFSGLKKLQTATEQARFEERLKKPEIE